MTEPFNHEPPPNWKDRPCDPDLVISHNHAPAPKPRGAHADNIRAAYAAIRKAQKALAQVEANVDATAALDTLNLALARTTAAGFAATRKSRAASQARNAQGSRGHVPPKKVNASTTAADEWLKKHEADLKPFDEEQLSDEVMAGLTDPTQLAWEAPATSYDDVEQDRVYRLRRLTPSILVYADLRNKGGSSPNLPQDDRYSDNSQGGPEGDEETYIAPPEYVKLDGSRERGRWITARQRLRSHVRARQDGLDGLSRVYARLAWCPPARHLVKDVARMQFGVDAPRSMAYDVPSKPRTYLAIPRYQVVEDFRSPFTRTVPRSRNEVGILWLRRIEAALQKGKRQPKNVATRVRRVIAEARQALLLAPRDE